MGRKDTLRVAGEWEREAHGDVVTLRGVWGFRLRKRACEDGFSTLPDRRGRRPPPIPRSQVFRYPLSSPHFRPQDRAIGRSLLV